MILTKKKIDFLDLSGKGKVTIEFMPPSTLDNPKITIGCQVLVQTQRAKDLKFYIMLEVTKQCREGFIGKVVGPEGYQGPHEALYPGEYLKFEFDGLTVDDEVWFEKRNVTNVF